MHFHILLFCLFFAQEAISKGTYPCSSDPLAKKFQEGKVNAAAKQYCSSVLKPADYEATSILTPKPVV
jgi:hypothetical protein